jgi:hypothetical protein
MVGFEVIPNGTSWPKAADAKQRNAIATKLLGIIAVFFMYPFS